MSSELLDIYREAALARWRATSHSGREEVRRPGLCGLLDAPEHPRLVLLVTDDRSSALLTEILANAQAGMIQVFTTAAQSLARLEQEPAWEGSPSTAMVCRRLATTPHVALSSPLRCRSVRRTEEDPSDGVLLSDAVACVVRAAPREDPAELSAFLRSLTATRLFAAVDQGGEVRATAGYELVGGHARVLLIDTDPAWQRQGLATAMTSAALVDAQRHGACEASLDASDRGGSVYRRLGFESVGPTVRFRR